MIGPSAGGRGVGPRNRYRPVPHQIDDADLGVSVKKVDESNIGIWLWIVLILGIVATVVVMDLWLHRHGHEYLTTEFKERPTKPGMERSSRIPDRGHDQRLGLALLLDTGEALTEQVRPFGGHAHRRSHHRRKVSDRTSEYG